MAAQVARRRFTVGEYHRMGEAGILSEDDRVELIDGEIVTMTPIGPRHATRVAAIYHRLQVALGGRAVVWVQNPIGLGPHHEPRPDVCLLKPPLHRYEARLPGADDVQLLVEVSDTSLGYDRGVKLPIYGTAGVAEVWLVDLDGAAVEVHHAPTAGGYTDVRRARRGERVSPQAFPDVSLAVDDLLG